MSLGCGIYLSKLLKATSARAYTNIEADKLGMSVGCGISLSKFKATSHWVPSSHALIATLKQIALVRRHDCGITHHGPLSRTRLCQQARNLLCCSCGFCSSGCCGGCWLRRRQYKRRERLL
jgi:hypothetical protein